jgi:hypothetical protein
MTNFTTQLMTAASSISLRIGGLQLGSNRRRTSTSTADVLLGCGGLHCRSVRTFRCSPGRSSEGDAYSRSAALKLTFLPPIRVPAVGAGAFSRVAGVPPPGRGNAEAAGMHRDKNGGRREPR